MERRSFRTEWKNLMTQPTFNRGLQPEFVEALNELYDRPVSWWRRLVDDRDLFLAVRGNYVNVYYLGCSLLRLKSQTKGVVGEVHYKYLLRPTLSTSEYIRIRDGRPESLPPVEHMFTGSLVDLDALKTAARPYAGLEKAGVHDVVLSNWNVVDVEIAFATGESDESETSVPRVDFAVLQQRNRHVELVFFEAKHFTNSELRAGGCADPKVVGQIDGYAALLRDRHDEIVDSYRAVCDNLLNLRGLPERHPGASRDAQEHRQWLDAVDGQRGTSAGRLRVRRRPTRRRALEGTSRQAEGQAWGSRALEGKRQGVHPRNIQVVKAKPDYVQGSGRGRQLPGSSHVGGPPR